MNTRVKSHSCADDLFHEDIKDIKDIKDIEYIEYIEYIEDRESDIEKLFRPETAKT